MFILKYSFTQVTVIYLLLRSYILDTKDYSRCKKKKNEAKEQQNDIPSVATFQWGIINNDFYLYLRTCLLISERGGGRERGRETST